MSPETADKIARLEAALASGELTIESNGERVTYRDNISLISAINYFRAQAQSESAQPAFGTTLATFGGR